MSTRPFTLSKRPGGAVDYTPIATFPNYPSARKALLANALGNTIAGVHTSDDRTVMELMLIDPDRRMTEYRIEAEASP